MKLAYRDRILLLIICVVIILGIGGFVFVKPKYEKLQKAEKSYKEASDAWDLKLSEYDVIPKYQKTIQDRRQEAYDISTNFTDEMDAVALDKFLQENFLNTEKNIQYKTMLKSAFAVSDEGTTGMGYYYYTPSIVTYPLMEYADFDGSIKAANDEKRRESVLKGALGTQTVGAGNATFTVHISYENCMEFIDAVREFAQTHKDAMILNSVTFEDCKFNGGKTVERDEEGKLTGSRPGGLPKKYDKVDDEELGYTNVTFQYSVFYMQEPTEVNVGDPYDKTIWDGNEWRSFKLPETENAQ